MRDAHGHLTVVTDAVTLHEKEGLALINGTDGMLGMLVLAIHDLRCLLTTADITAAMSVEGLLGTDRVFAADLHALRPQDGQQASAANLRALLADSPIVASHRGPEDTRVQDAYSLRCAPQVAGAARDTLAHATHVAQRELASAIDNPVVTEDGRVESNGNFHGAPIAYVLDFLAIAAADVASMAERRTDRFLDVARSHGLPAFLADDPGVDSGYMIAQYTQAALVSEMKRLAVPASVDSIPSSAMQEDHVSMGWSAARKLRTAVDALAQVLAIELLTAVARHPTAGAPDPVARHRRRHRRPGHPPRPRPLPRARDRGGHRLRQVRRRTQRRRSDHRRARMKTVIRAARGTELSCRGWQQEAALRMLHNNLDPDVAEHPDELVVYGGTGKAARDWNSVPRDRAARCRRWPTTRRCWCSPASPSASCRRTSGRRAC